MKKILLILLTTVLLLTSCNMDATSGIFQSVMNSQTIVTEPIEQIIKMGPDGVYFTSSKGIYKFDSKGYSSVYKNANGVRVDLGIIADDVSSTTLYFTSSTATAQEATIRFHKLVDGVVTTIPDFGLTKDDEIIKVENKENIYINNEKEQIVYRAKLNTLNDTIEKTLVVLPYPDSVKNNSEIGVEMHGNSIMFIYRNNDKATYNFKYYFIKDTDTSFTEVDSSFTKRITGTYVNDDGSWIATSLKDGNVYIEYFDATGNYLSDKSFDTSHNYNDTDIAIGKLGDKYFFRPATSPNVYYFADGASSTSSMKYNNFSSAIDFVSIKSLDTAESAMLVATSQNGFYKLTSLTDANGLRRIDTL